MLRKIVGALAGASLALAATGCAALPGGAGALGGPSVADVMKGLVDKTETVETYRAEMSISGSMGGQTVDTSSDITYSSTPEPTYKMESEFQGQQSVMLMRGSEMVMQGDPATGGGWMRVDTGETGMDQAQDPMAEVQKLLAGTDVEEVGSEDVNGVSTTKYAGSYTTAEALAKVEDAEAKAAAQKVYDQSGISKIDFQVWVDGDGFPRRVQSSAGSNFDTTLDFTEFNQPVDIEYPDASQITDMDNMLDGLGDAGAGAGDVPELPEGGGLDIPDTSGY